MKYKLIAMDMDGTLLNSRREITPETQEILKKAVKQGCYITLSTGRSLPAVTHFFSLLPLNAPLILYNGAMVTRTNGRVLFHQPLMTEEVSAVLSSPQAPESVILWHNNQLFLSAHTAETDHYERSNQVQGQLLSSASSFSDCTKLLWIDEPEALNKRKTALSGSLPDTISYCNSRADYLEFFSSLVSKGTALTFLCSYLNISPEETIAFGDGENDISLLNAAGLSIAMGNADPETKKSADYVTASNDDNGIVTALNRFL